MLWNILLVYVAYTVCRVAFILANAAVFTDTDWWHIAGLLKAGLVFDSSAICYTNSLVILMMLLPFHWKERKGYYRAVRWVYVVVNGLCIVANLCDAVYFPFTGRRTTLSVLQEFSNEGAGQMTRIVAGYAVANWYLVLVGALLVAMLWRGFAMPRVARVKVHTVRDTVEYYSVHTVALVLAVVVSVGLMRGGFATSVRPITISNANQYADGPLEAGAVLNTPFAIIRTAGKKSFVVPDYMDDATAAGLYSPVHYPSAGGVITPSADGAVTADKPMNVVILIMESFSKQHIGFYNAVHNENGEGGDKVTFTPFLDSFIASKGLTFRYSYSNGRKSIDGMPSVLSSIPMFVEPFILTPASMNDMSSIARELSENKGYTSAFFHGAENGSMGFMAYARSCGFQKYYGLDEYCADSKYGGKDDFDGTWAIWDEEFLQFYCDRMSEMKEPFVTAVFTATSHSPYDLPERYKGKYRKGKDPSQELVMYSDNALRLFFESASRQPWFDNTIFVITADHTSANVDEFYNGTIGHYCVPIVFYAPGMPELRGYDESTVVEQIDIMPTLLGMLGYDKPYVAFGQDIFSTPASDKFAIHWVPATSSYEFVMGDYAIHFDGQDVSAVYDYKTDLLQRSNLIGSIPADSVAGGVMKMKSVIQQYMQRMNTNKLIYRNEQK